MGGANDRGVICEALCASTGAAANTSQATIRVQAADKARNRREIGRDVPDCLTERSPQLVSTVDESDFNSQADTRTRPKPDFTIFGKLSNILHGRSESLLHHSIVISQRFQGVGVIAANEANSARRIPVHECDRSAIDLSDKAKLRIIACATRAFHDQGYDALSMSALAECCGITRRALYHHFSNKEEVLRAIIRTNNALAVLKGHEACREALAGGASAVDPIAVWLDHRFGTTRRNIGESVHGQELNDAAFRLATDIMIEVSYESNLKLAELVAELCQRGQLRLRPGYSPERIGRLLGDGARGVNQSRPPFPNHEIAQRYRDIVEATLFGCAVADDAGPAR